jgi:hypothetical protein
VKSLTGRQNRRGTTWKLRAQRPRGGPPCHAFKGGTRRTAGPRVAECCQSATTGSADAYAHSPPFRSSQRTAGRGPATWKQANTHKVVMLPCLSSAPTEKNYSGEGGAANKLEETRPEGGGTPIIRRTLPAEAGNACRSSETEETLVLCARKTSTRPDRPCHQKRQQGAVCVQFFDDSRTNCGSHHLSQFATIFIGPNAKPSIAKSCIVRNVL